MEKRYLAPVFALLAAVAILVPTTLAKGGAGDTFGVAFGPNRFPGGLNTATMNLTFVSDETVRLDATVQGSDVRAWTIRVYDAGTCQRPLHWVVSRPGTNGAGQSIALSVFTNQSISVFLDPADVARLRAVPDFRNLAFMFAGSGAGSLNSGSAYRTCAVAGNGPVATTTRTSTSSSTTTSATTNAACVTTRTSTGTVTTISGTATTIGGTATTIGGVLTTVGGATTTIGGTTITSPGTTTLIGGTATTVGGVTFTFGGSTSVVGGTATTVGGSTTTIDGVTTTVAGTPTTISGTATTIGGTVTTIGGTATTIAPVTSTANGATTTVTGTRTSGTCVFP